MLTSFPIYGAWGIGQSSPAAGTAIAALVPPYKGPPNSAPALYALVNGVPNWWNFGGFGGAITRVSSLLFTESTTVHTVYVLRPKNFTTFKTAVAKNATAITLAADPGLYSTAGNYLYPLPAGQTVPTLAADNTIAASDYVAYQMDDGVWQIDTIASGTFGGGNLVLTTGTPNRTGSTISAGRPLFWFGVAADTDPATGLADPSFKPTASTNKINQIQDSVAGGISSLHPGDPLVIFSANATAAGILDMASGYYGPF